MLSQSDTDQDTKSGIGSWVRIADFRKLLVSVFGIKEYPDYSLFPGPLGGNMPGIPALKTLPLHCSLQGSSRAGAREISKLSQSQEFW